MEITNICPFIITSLIFVLIPGPNLIYIITQGVSVGRKGALKAVLGASAGDVLQVAAATLGLGALLQASATAFLIVKVIGACYLFFAGLRCCFGGRKIIKLDDERQITSKDLLVYGFLTSALNPKTTLFFFSFLPQFVDPLNANAQVQMLSLGLIFVIMGFAVMAACAFAAAKLRKWICNNERIQTYLQWVTGLVFISFGLRLVFAERR